MNFHYEFDDILKLDKILYKVTLPALTDACWINDAKYYLFESTTIKVYCRGTLLDIHHYKPYCRVIHNLYNPTKNVHGENIVKLFPYNIYKSFSHLVYDQVPPYKVVCDVKINLWPNLRNMCSITDHHNDKLKPEMEGAFGVVEILEKSDGEHL